jgi:molecular chaperone GrpE
MSEQDETAGGRAPGRAPDQPADQRADRAESAAPAAGGRSGPGGDRPGQDGDRTGPDGDTEAAAAAALAELRARAAQLEDQWRRAVADLDNLRKRMARQIEQQRSDERARVAAEWLPVLDNLELALEHAGADPASIVEGVQAVRDQALAVLARLGFPRHAEVGARFDPARHEAVATVADPDAPPGTVLHVVRPGYGEEERQLRPAAVVVATRSE